MEQVQKTNKMVNHLETKAICMRNNEYGYIKSTYRQWNGDTTVFKYLRDSHIEEGMKLFSIVPEGIIRIYVLKIQGSSLRLETL